MMLSPPRSRPPLSHRHSALPRDFDLFKDTPYVEYESESESSANDSTSSVPKHSKKSKSKSSRRRTTYHICYPPPSHAKRQRKNTRDRSLLQLHKAAHTSRPTPALELVNAATLPPSHYAEFPKDLSRKPGHTDLAIVNAENYSQHDHTLSGQSEPRNLVALLFKDRKADRSHATFNKITLHDGTEWTVLSMSNGGYEFTSTDKHNVTVTVRWVLKKALARRSITALDAYAGSFSKEITSPRASTDSLQSYQSAKQFNFSIISPNTRRHPVIAHLSNTTIDIQDSYSMPQPTSVAEATGLKEPLMSKPIETTPALRTLITTTGIWIALREGWSPGYRPTVNAILEPQTFSIPESETRPKSMTISGDPRRETSLGKRAAIASALRKAINLSPIPIPIPKAR